MAEKARQLAKSNYGLSFTGVAGDSIEGQPTGTVWIGLAEEGQPTVAECFHFNRDRNYIRQSAVMRGLDLCGAESLIKINMRMFVRFSCFLVQKRYDRPTNRK